MPHCEMRAVRCRTQQALPHCEMPPRGRRWRAERPGVAASPTAVRSEPCRVRAGSLGLVLPEGPARIPEGPARRWCPVGRSAAGAASASDSASAMEVVEDPAPLWSAVVLTAQAEEHREKLRTDPESLRHPVQSVWDAAVWRGAEWRQGPGRLAAVLGMPRPTGLKEIEEAVSAVAAASGSEGASASAPSPLPGQAPWPSVAHQARGAVEGRLQPRPSPLGAGSTS